MSAEIPTLPAEVDHRIAVLEEAVRQKSKDRWDKAQIAAGFISSVAIALVGLLINYRLDQNQQRHAEQQEMERLAQDNRQEANRLAQVVAEIESNRERSDTEIRARMFEALIRQFFQGDLGDQKKMMLLSLFLTNFQEFFNAGPLFAMMETEVEGRTEKEAMRKSAQAVAERQELALGAGLIRPELFRLRQAKDVMVGEHALTIELTDIREDAVKVNVKAAEPDDLKFREVDFRVSYFDMPFMDHTKLPDGHRFAVTLKEINSEEGTAYLKVFEFDPNYLGSRDRPALDQLRHLIDSAVPPNDHAHEVVRANVAQPSAVTRASVDR